jgi:two-component system phosphate regulon sensor histidine kinase PhoR
MARKRLFLQLYPPFLLMTIVALLTISWYSTRTVKGFYLEQIRKDLEVRSRLLNPAVENYLSADKVTALDSFCNRMGKETATRFTVIGLDGKVFADSEKDYESMENHSDRPEIKTAYAGLTGNSVRYSSTLKTNMMYVAIPVNAGGKLVAVLRSSKSIDSINGTLHGIYWDLFYSGLFIAIVSGFLSFLIVKKISRPMEEIKNSAQEIAAGNLDVRLPIPDTEEIGQLAGVLNNMAEQLKQKLYDITSQRNELDAILASMQEGVIAIDMDANIISINRAASKLLSTTGEVTGRTLHEVVRNTALQDFAEKVLSEQVFSEDELTFYNHEEHFLQLHGNVLKDMQGKMIGALIVLNDITHVRKLENLRKDFVANVSHEIKTPLTAIKGSVETLQNGALKDPADTIRFMNIIAKHSDRLNALVEDILSLSSIERDKERNELNMEAVTIREIIDTAVDLCREKSEAGKIRLEVNCPEDLEAEFDRTLFEQALVNLIDNAIKYSEQESQVEITAESQNRQLKISVRDYGCGIPKEHIPRLFERFFRVDKARSRKLGGTGLGLAIVKHIAQIHNGTVTVESTPGKGSCFTISIPEPKASENN